MASCTPGDERQRDSKDNEHNESGSDLETFIAQKYGEGAAIKKQSSD